MAWRPMSSIIPEATQAPYLLEHNHREEVEARLKVLGYQVRLADAAGFQTGRDASRAVARELEYPDFFPGGWDGFFDLLATEFIDNPRRIVIGLLNAHELARRDLRLFVNASWHLFNATETIESQGGGDWQLEFLYWGQWLEFHAVSNSE